MENYNDYLKISDEIKLNKLVSEIDIAIAFNDMQMDNYDEETAMKRLTELNKLYQELLILKNEAIMHENYKVYDYCEVYHFDLEYQMNLLRRKYMKEVF